MKLYRAKIESIAREVIDTLVRGSDIEVTNHQEAELDIQSVLKEYLRLEREVVEQTKDTLEARHLSHGQFGRVKRLIAEQKGLGIGDDAVVWICNQILETFMESNFVEEIFSSDSDMRRKILEILKRQMMMDEELDAEVRQRIKNLAEGTAAWDVEYGRAMEQMKRKRGIRDE